MSSPFRLTVVAPVYNEEEVVPRFYEEVRNVLKALGPAYEWRLLFVLDRSTDQSLARLKAIAAEDANVQILVLSSRFGHQMSLLAGIDNARNADAVIMMDSDQQHPATLIPRMLAAHAEGNDVVFTVRADSADSRSLRARLGKGFYSALAGLSKTPINANAADFRLISRRVADVLRGEIRERNMFLRGLFAWIGFNQTSIEYIEGARAAGQSKYSISRLIRFAMAGLLAFSTRPLRIMILAGALIAGFGFLMGVFTIYQFFANAALPPGWATIVTLLLFFSGVQLLSVGIVGAYVGVIYDEVKRRPHYIVDERINI